MKLNVKRTALLLAVVATTMLSLHAQTTVASGNWSNPATWGGVPPTGTGTIVINHAVTLDVDYSQVSGSITVNASGSLIGNSPTRIFALNYPSGSASLIINGPAVNVARIYLLSGTVSVTGNLVADSLYNAASINIAQYSYLTPTVMMNDGNGTVANTGDFNTSQLLNLGSVTNHHVLMADTFYNAHTLVNDSVANMWAVDFLNRDTLSLQAHFTNNGYFRVDNDWMNTSLVDGAGRFCIQNNTFNAGTMSGTFDFCDVTGGNIDLNIGTITPGITYCNYTCLSGIADNRTDATIRVFPNPSDGVITVSQEFHRDDVLKIYTAAGELVRTALLENYETTLDLRTLPAGFYIYHVEHYGQTVARGKIVLQ